MRWLPPKEWWFTPPPDRPGDWWRAHVPAHIGHGALFTLWAVAIGVESPVMLAFDLVVLWDAWQRETWASMPLWSNLWDTLLGLAGITLTMLLLSLL